MGEGVNRPLGTLRMQGYALDPSAIPGLKKGDVVRIETGPSGHRFFVNGEEKPLPSSQQPFSFPVEFWNGQQWEPISATDRSCSGGTERNG
jgi:hypothetical protein